VGCTIHELDWEGRERKERKEKRDANKACSRTQILLLLAKRPQASATPCHGSVSRTGGIVKEIHLSPLLFQGFLHEVISHSFQIGRLTGMKPLTGVCGLGSMNRLKGHDRIDSQQANQEEVSDDGASWHCCWFLRY